MRSIIRKIIKDFIPQSILVQKLGTLASNCILLTFDDGPHPDITPDVLKRLEAYEARAIFFIAGKQIGKAPFLLKLIKKQGHIIGNHTYIHSNRKQPWFLAYWRDILQCQSEIKKYIGEKPRFFRPAGGRISLSILLASWLTGLRTVTWSLEVRDWSCRSFEEARHCGEILINNLKPNDIILLHDDNPNVLTILDMVLPNIRSRKINLYDGIKFLMNV